MLGLAVCHTLDLVYTFNNIKNTKTNPLIYASVAQWQSASFVNWKSRVQFPSEAFLLELIFKSPFILLMVKPFENNAHNN